MTDLKTKVVSALQSASDIPALLREMAPSVTSLCVDTFDQSYIEFLESQIRLEPRGPEWTAVLSRRKDILQAYCDRPLIDAHVPTDKNVTFWIKVDPEPETLVFWEQEEGNWPANNDLQLTK